MAPIVGSRQLLWDESDQEPRFSTTKTLFVGKTRRRGGITDTFGDILQQGACASLDNEGIACTQSDTHNDQARSRKIKDLTRNEVIDRLVNQIMLTRRTRLVWLYDNLIWRLHFIK